MEWTLCGSSWDLGCPGPARGQGYHGIGVGSGSVAELKSECSFTPRWLWSYGGMRGWGRKASALLSPPPDSQAHRKLSCGLGSLSPRLGAVSFVLLSTGFAHEVGMVSGGCWLGRT